MLISITFILEKKEEGKNKRQKEMQPSKSLLSYIPVAKFQESLNRNKGFV